ncbi:hypothetical protein [Algoriphagus formosus]|uniref:hypothetical protein n=1 Tax=Algoriphagus formosus TaxID=2007308 RepID=UPI000C291669|nr:hypothetical protein [Algoriphagus formosus]
MTFDFDDNKEDYNFHPVQVTLNSGLELTLKGFHLTFTYGGLIEGNPLQGSVIEFIKEEIRVPKNWGERKLFSIPAKEDGLNTLLPLFSCYAYLTSDIPAGDSFADGSELVVHWFEKSIQDRPITLVIEEAVKDLNWKNEADDFLY